jgi:hypothetical protein
MRTFFHITWFLIFAIGSYFTVVYLVKNYQSIGMVVACFLSLIYYIGRDYINYLMNKEDIQNGH